MELPESAPSNKLKTWLFNPFYYIAGGTALGVGLAVMVIASLVGAATNYHFDGVIDLHSGTPAPAWVFVAENLINWLVMGVLVYLAGRLTIPEPDPPAGCVRHAGTGARADGDHPVLRAPPRFQARYRPPGRTADAGFDPVRVRHLRARSHLLLTG